MLRCGCFAGGWRFSRFNLAGALVPCVSTCLCVDRQHPPASARCTGTISSLSSASYYSHTAILILYFPCVFFGGVLPSQQGSCCSFLKSHFPTSVLFFPCSLSNSVLGQRITHNYLSQKKNQLWGMECSQNLRVSISRERGKQLAFVQVLNVVAWGCSLWDDRYFRVFFLESSGR